MQPYSLIKSKRKTIALIITKNATLEIRAPIHTSLDFINNLIIKKQKWIQRKIIERQQRLKHTNTLKEFRNGIDFLYLGKTYMLQIQNCRQIALTDDLIFPEHLLPAAQKYLTLWYKKQAHKTIVERVELYAKKTGINKHKKIRISNATTSWGSCNARGGLSFNWHLIMAPLEVLDYVVVHELMHFIEMNHSLSFWQHVKAIIPDYANKRRWLKENGHLLML